MDHVAFIRPKPLEALYAGRKQWEVRLSKRETPIMKVSAGDRCLIKRSCQEIEASTRIKEAATFCDLTPSCIAQLQSTFGSGLDFEEEYWDSHQGANYATLIKFGEYTPVSLSAKYTPTAVRLGWVAGFEHFEEAHPKSQMQEHLLV